MNCKLISKKIIKHACSVPFFWSSYIMGSLIDKKHDTFFETSMKIFMLYLHHKLKSRFADSRL